MSTHEIRLATFSILIAALLLAGCEGRVTADLVADAPADPDIQQVNATLAGLEFRRSDGGTESLSFRNGQPVNLYDLLDGNAMRLFTDEELPEGNYNGVRLVFDGDPRDDPIVVSGDGSVFPLTIEQGDYVGVNIQVDENESSKDAFTLTLDLRQSLIFDDNADEYTLRPYLRSVDSDRFGVLIGTVDITCPSGSSLAQGGAVYLFSGRNIEPDDRDGVGVEPYATTDVYDTTNGQSAYAFRFLPEGDYTIAITCDGDQDSPDTDDSDDMSFALTDNVKVDRDDTQRYDFTN